ncbi:uncharacterized protein LOC121747597 isoform X2 [Salvia splendens]|uniref:uncharacterized protein LOC121747597 isoform X2 n=1 Tax=Salvia splendens TaxID=180675 RepID=UPI001C27C804|nr:uncharacterized protein LOC121747597 isoform X2 [Salvia splendens]
MEGGCSASSPSELSNASATSGGGGGDGGASKFLANLPSRGNFSSTVLSSCLGGARVYICHRDTSPPDNQVIRTNQTNILIRSLMLMKQKGDSGSRDGKGAGSSQGSRKRAAEKSLDGKAAGKKAMSSTQHGSSQELQSLTVDKLRALLRDKGLSATGRKDELIARLRGANG